MAKRKSLNKRSGRFSRASGDSRILDPDTRILGEEEPFWWRHLEDNTATRRSTLLNIANETSPLLNATSRLESSKGNHEWWKMLDASDATNGERTIRQEKHASPPEDNNDDSHDSEDGKEPIKKRKLLKGNAKRKSLKGNAFLSALDTSKESTVSMPLPKTKGHFNDSAISENAVQPRLSRSQKSMDSKANYSQSMEDVVKLKPKLTVKRRMSKSRNMFDDVLKEHVMDTPRKLSLRRSRTAELQEGNEDNESVIMSQPRPSTFGVSFDNTDSESSNALIPKAQSTLLESTSAQMNLSDSSISEQNVQKLKPKVLKWTAKSAQSNNFQDILESEGQGDLVAAEGSTRKSDSLKQKSQHKQSLADIPHSSIRTSTAMSSKRLSTSVQKRQKASSPAVENDTQPDANESDDSSVGHSEVNAAYKPKSKFLNAWKKTNQQRDTLNSHTASVEELETNNGEPIIDIENVPEKSDTELFDAALRKSVEPNNEESDHQAEHSRNDRVSKQFQQTGNKSSHLENSATFNQLNILSKKGKSSLSKSQKSMTHAIRRSSNIQNDKLPESADRHTVSPEIGKDSYRDILHNEIDGSRKDVHGQSTNSDQPGDNDDDDDDDDDDEKLQQSTRRSTHSKSSSHRTSQITSSARIVPDDITRKENDQLVGRAMRSSLHSARTTSQLNSFFEHDTDKEDDQTIGQSTHKQSSHRISSSPVRKGSKIRTTTVAENDSVSDENEVMLQNTRRSEYNKSLSRRISDSPTAKAAKTKTQLLPASDTDDEIEQNKGQSLRASRRERSSRRLTESSTSKASRTKVSTIAEDDTQNEDDQVMRQSTRHTSYNKSSSRRISDSPSKVAKAKATVSPASDTDDEINENKRRSSRTGRRERSSRNITESPKASRTRISIIAEDDAQEDNEIMGQNTRHTSYNKSSSRRISDSPHSQLAKTKTALLAASDTDDEIDESKRRSSRLSTRERSSRRLTESSTSKASRTKISTIAEENDEFIGQSTRRSTRNKSSMIIDQNVLDEEDPVSINEVPAGTHSVSRLRRAESMISADDQESRLRNEKTGGSIYDKSTTSHLLQYPLENMAKEKLTVLDEDDNDDEATETFRLITSRQGRSSTPLEAVTNDSTSYIFKARKSKSGVSYKDDDELHANEDNEETPNRLLGNVRNKSVSLRRKSNRNFSISKVRHSTLNENRVGETNESTSKTMRQSTNTRTVPKERRSKRISNALKAKTAEKSINESDTPNAQNDGDSSARVTLPVTSSPRRSTSKRRLKEASDSESTDDEIISRTHKEKATIQLSQQKRRSAASSISDEEQIIEENEIRDIEDTVDENVMNPPMNPPSRKSLHPAAGRNRSTKSTSNLKNLHSTQDNVSEDEEQDTAKSGATVASSQEMTGEVRDMSSINISNMTRRSPLLSSTRRSIFLNPGNKRKSKLSSPPSSKYSAVDNMPTSPINPAMEDDFAEPENERSPVRMSGVSGGDRKKFSDGSRKSSFISQARASTSLAKNGDETRQTGHRFHRVNNTIPEESSTNYEDPVANTTEKEQSTRNQRPITKQQNKTNEGIEKSTTLKKPQEDSQMGTQQENSTFNNIFTKNKTIAEDARSKRISGKSVITERTLGNVSKQKEFGTQRSMMDFLQGRTQNGFNRTIFTTQSDSQSDQPSAALVLSDPHKVEEIKKQIAEEIGKQREMVNVRKKAGLSPVKKVKPTKNLMRPTKPRPKKAVDSAYLVHGEVYKPPPLSRPKYWVTNRLYQYLEKCLLPKYDISTRVRSEKFIKYLVTVTTLVKKRKKYDNYKDDVNRLMKQMAHLGIIQNRSDFYHFCYDFLPYEIRAKLVPIALPGNKQTIPYDPKLLYVPLLNTSSY